MISGVLVFCNPPLEARSCRVNLTPNASKFQCLTCHTNSNGGARNAFGAAVQVIVRTSTCQTTFWGPELAAMDSDGDGRANGEELGDPAGAWKPGDPRPGDLNLVTQPGVRDFPPPILSSVEPAQAARDGSTAVNVQGINFRDTTQVRIGRYVLLSPRLVSAELISGFAPALGASEAGGAKDVVAIEGTSRSTLRGAITYPDLPPLVLTSVTPDQVLRDGTTAVTVTGENFLADTRIRIAGRDLVNPTPASADGRMMTGLAPPLGPAEPLGARDVTASDGRGRVTLAAGVTYIDAAGGTRFVRGDATGDGQVNVTDAVDTLHRHFKGGAALACSAAADSNDDARVDLSDPVFILDYLFQGRGSPAPPFPACGPGTENDLACDRASCP
jgi:hypothetical protein